MESPWWSIGILIKQLRQIIGYVEKIKSFCIISTFCLSYSTGSNWRCNHSVYVNFLGSILGIATNLFTVPIWKGWIHKTTYPYMLIAYNPIPTLRHNFLEKSQNTPMSTQDSSLELKITTPKIATRGGNFSMEEDVLLVSAWLNTSVDPMHGNEQKQETFTAKVWQYFFMHNKYGTKHSSSSLKSRWSTINRKTSKFCGFMAKIEAKNQSDATNKDKV